MKISCISSKASGPVVTKFYAEPSSDEEKNQTVQVKWPTWLQYPYKIKYLKDLEPMGR